MPETFATHPSQQHRGRLARRALFCLSLGVLIAIASALPLFWTAAIDANTAHWGNTNPPENRVHAHRGTIRVAIIRDIDADPDGRTPDIRKWWMRAATVPDDKLAYTWEIAHGWPLPLLSSGALGTRNPDATTTDTAWGRDFASTQYLTIHMPGRVAETTLMLGLPKQYPTRIIWPGLVGNTIFYAPIVWGLIALLAWRRRAFRRRRGRCEGCAYSLKGLESAARCPECGRSVPTGCHGQVADLPVGSGR